MGTVKQTFTGDSKDLEAAYKRIERENVKLREEVKKTAHEHKEGAEEAEGLLGAISEHLTEQIEHVVEYAVEWATVHKAMELVSEELERIGELQEKALETQKEAGAARPALYRNLAGLNREEMREVREGLDQIQQKYSIVGEHVLDQAMTQAASAAGGDYKQALTNIDVAARMVPDAAQHPDELASLAGTLGDLTKITGSADAEENLGTLLGVMHTARVSTIQDAGKNLVPSALSLKQHGATDSQAFALINALGQSIIDPTGEQTGTGLIKFGEAVHKFFQPEQIEARAADKLSSALHPVLGKKADTATLGSLRQFLGARGLEKLPADPHEFAKQAGEILRERPELAEQFVGAEVAKVRVAPNDLMAQIHYLQAHRDESKEIDERFVSEGAFEEGRGNFGRARTIAALRSLLNDPSSLMARQVEQFAAEIPRGENARGIAREQVSMLNEDKAVSVKQLSDTADVFQEQTLTDLFQQHGRIAAYKEAYAAVLNMSSTGLGSAFTNALSRAYFKTQVDYRSDIDAGGMFQAETRGKVERLRYELAHPTLGDVFTGDVADPERAVKEGTLRRRTDKADLELADRLERFADRMAEIDARLSAPEEEEPREAPERAVAKGEARPGGQETRGQGDKETRREAHAAAPERAVAKGEARPAGQETRGQGDKETRREAHAAAPERAVANGEARAAEPPLGEKRKEYLKTHGPMTKEDVAWSEWRDRYAPELAFSPPAETEARGQPAWSPPDITAFANAQEVGFGYNYSADALRAEAPVDQAAGSEFKGRTIDDDSLAQAKTRTAADWAQHQGELKFLINSARTAAWDLDHHGRFNARGEFDETIDERDPTEKDKSAAAAIRRMADNFERLLQAIQQQGAEQRQQQARQHRDNQAAGRSQRVRTRAAGINGRE